jgi:DNA repair exonuclease SbcCD ATPase subunit
MLKKISIFILLFAFSSAAELKNNANIDMIINKIDLIAEQIKQKEEQLRKQREEQMEQKTLLLPPEQKETIQEKQQRELNEKRTQLTYLKDKYQLDSEFSKIAKKNRKLLENKARKLVKVASSYIKGLKQQRLKVRVQEFFEINNKLFVYVNKEDLSKATKKLNDNLQSIQKLENDSKVLKFTKDLDINSISSGIEKLENNIMNKNTISSSSTYNASSTGSSSKNMIKISINDIIENVLVGKVTKQYIQVKLLDNI